jgi:hypothetical protein
MAERWRIVGDFIDFCKCRVPCACSWGQPPDEGDCDGVIAYRIREGNYGDVKLDGLNLAALTHFDGNIWDDDVRLNMGMIVDERSDEAQVEAIQTIFSGQVGSWPKVFAEEVMGEMLGMEVAPVDLQIADDGKSWSLKVPGRITASTEVVSGPTTRPGDPVAVTNAPGSEAGPNSGPLTYGIASENQAEGFGFKWDWAGRSSKRIPFVWSSDDEF